MAGQIDRLKAEIGRIRHRADTQPTTAEVHTADERPPHY
jgi:uncharacterized coiled-coil protein SlyX